MRVPVLSLIVSGLLAVGCLVTVVPAGATPLVTVGNAQLRSCAPAPTPPVCADLTEGGTAIVVDAEPANRDLGRGYLRLSTPSATADASVTAVGAAPAGGLQLKALQRLEFRTLVETPGFFDARQTPVLTIRIDPHKAGARPATLVWEPRYTGTAVLTRRWQTWDATTARGGWWSTMAGPLVAGDPNAWGFPSYTASFTDVLAALPDATVLGISIDQRAGSTGLRSGVDRLVVNESVYDFDNPPVVEPTHP